MSLFLVFRRKDSTDSFLTKLWQKIAPRKTVEFILDTTVEIDLHWDNVEVHGASAMSIQSEWYATNLTDEQIWMLRAYLVKPRTEAMMLLTQAPGSDEFGRYSILPRSPTRVSADFCIQPPICKPSESFKGKIVFVDQFNNKHKVKVTFKPPIQEQDIHWQLKVKGKK